MNQTSPANQVLLAGFTHWWHQNKKGGWFCAWRRRPVWVAQLMQKLGWHREVSAPLFWGEQMQVITGETVSQQILTFGYSEIAITALMLWLVESGQTVVDIGTHFGYEALLACKLVGSQGHVICFEPSPIALKLAKKNLDRFPQVELCQEAVADQPGVLRLQNRAIWESAFNSLSKEQTEAGSTEVPVTTLDLALANRTRPVDFLKCDVEGFEMAALKGAHNFLSEDAPVLVLEADMPSREGKVSARACELAAHLESYGYQAFNFDFDGCFRIGALDSFPVHHANVALIPRTCPDLLAQIKGVQTKNEPSMSLLHS